MTSLREFVQSRRTELMKQLKPLRSRQEELDQSIAAIRQQISEITSELDQINRIELEFSNSNIAGKNTSITEKTQMTMKQAIRKILAGRPNGLTASEILVEMAEKYGLSYERSSLSPQLSRLKSDDEVHLEQGRWILS